MRRNNDQVRVIVLRAPHQLHPNIIRRPDFRACLHIFLRQLSGQLRQSLLRRARQTLVVRAFLQHGHTCRQVRNRRLHVNQQQLGPEACREIRSNVQRAVRRIAEINRRKYQFRWQHSVVSFVPVSRRWKGQQRHPTKPIFRHITLLLLPR